MNKHRPGKNPSATQPSQPQAPARLGAEHGYRFDAERVSLSAELQLPAHLSSGSYALELWACSLPCEPNQDPASSAGSLRVARLQLRLPTPLAPLVHRIDAETNAALPGPGRSYAMVLHLVHEPVRGQRRVLDVANYLRREVFPAPQFQGEVSYEVDGNEVVLRAEGISNERAAGNQSGTLALELWGYGPEDEAGPGVCLAEFQLAPISGGYWIQPLCCRASLKRPDAGQRRTVMLLREWTAAGYVTRDQRATSTLQPVAVNAPVQAVRAAVDVRAVQPTKPLLSLQTASAAELVKLEGINARIAKEIIKARPLGSWSDLLRVRGVGQATVNKLKMLARL
jgi:DNA uptake protein ComE-like DNA-binding protein